MICIKPNESGILNEGAWVLAPQEKEVVLRALTAERARVESAEVTYYGQMSVAQLDTFIGEVEEATGDLSLAMS